VESGLAARVKNGRLSPKGFWKHPEPGSRKQGEPSPDLIFYAVGRSLTDWANLEETLASLYRMLCAPTTVSTDRAMMRTFGSIESVPARVKTLLAVAEVYFEHFWRYPGIKEVVDAIAEELNQATRIRNEIAHGKVISLTTVGTDETGAPRTENSGHILVSPNYMTGRTSPFPLVIDDDKFYPISSSLYRYNSQDILRFASQFCELNSIVMSYMTEIYKDEKTWLPKVILQEATDDPKAFQRKMQQLQRPQHS
jgi:hypothetical protein